MHAQIVDARPLLLMGGVAWEQGYIAIVVEGYTIWCGSHPGPVLAYRTYTKKGLPK